MILLGKEILGKAIIHQDTNEKKSEVQEILIHKDQPKIVYLTFEINAPNEPGQSDQEIRRIASTINASGASLNAGLSNATPGYTGPGAPVPEGHKKHTYLIASEQISNISDNAVIMHGSESEGAADEEAFSLSHLEDFQVKTTDGESLGKIKDIVIDEEGMKVVGLSLSEGFWQTLAHGTKYMPYSGIVQWKEDELIVEDTMKEQLVDHREQL